MKIEFLYNSLRCKFDSVTRLITSAQGCTMPITNASPGMRQAAMSALTTKQREIARQHQFEQPIL